jgi:CDP-diglyceride synthetase
MEDLAITVAGIFGGFIFLTVVNVILAVLARKRIIKFWIAILVNTVLGLVAIWGISIAWALGMVPFIGVAVASIILTFPTRKKP